MASVPLQKTKQLSLTVDSSPHPEKPQVYQWEATAARAALPIYATSLRYSDPDYDVILMPIWPTKLLPAITSARLVVLARATVARGDHGLSQLPNVDKLRLNKWQFKSDSLRVIN
jgi:hypothetical protein